MSEQSQVRVQLRSITLAEATTLRELPKSRAFIELSEPPPVRAVLQIVGEDSAPRGFEVEHVVELAEADSIGATGCYGSFVDEARLQQHQQVGSESLTPGQSQASPEDDGSDQPEPAAYDEAPAADAGATEPGDEDLGGSASAPEEEDPGSGTTETTPSGGKRRKGRKRK